MDLISNSATLSNDYALLIAKCFVCMQQGKVADEAIVLE